MDESASSLKYISRLQEIEEQARLATEAEIKKWEKFETDYKELKSCLGSLPAKVSHDVMIPVGSVALLPAQLIHTNEILVLLGDNWFAQRSAQQACQVIDRRIKHVERNLDTLKQDANLRVQNANFVDRMHSEQQTSGTVEIKEPLEEPEPTDHKGNTKRKAHNARHGVVPRSVKELDERRCARQTPKDATDDRELWERLNQLEIQEHEASSATELPRLCRIKQKHIEGLDSDDDDDSSDSSCPMSFWQESHLHDQSHVHFDQSADDKADELDSKELVEVYDESQRSTPDEKPLKSILKKERKLSTEDPKLKPILKASPERKMSSSGDEGDLFVGETNEGHCCEEKPQEEAMEAFSGRVVEKGTNSQIDPAQEVRTTSKPVSRFKAARQRR